MNKIHEANQFLEVGELNKAQDIFSKLLDKNPEDDLLIVGFYISSFWVNRIDSILIQKEGKDRCDKILFELSKFQSEFLRKNFKRIHSYYSILTCIGMEAYRQIIIQIQNKKSSEISSNAVYLLSKILCELKKFEEIVFLVKSLKIHLSNQAEVLFLFAEALFLLGDQKNAKHYFRKAFLLNPLAIDLEKITSIPLKNFIENLLTKIEDENLLKEYLPIVCLNENFYNEPPIYSQIEISNYFQELTKLKNSKQNTSGNVSFKINCRIYQISKLILENQSSSYTKDYKKETKPIFDLCSKELFKLN